MDSDNIKEYKKAQRIKKHIKNYIKDGVHNTVKLQNLYLEASFYGFLDEFPKSLWEQVDLNSKTPKASYRGFKMPISKSGNREKSYKKVKSAFSGESWSPESLAGDKWTMPSVEDYTEGKNHIHELKMSLTGDGDILFVKGQNISRKK